MEPIKGGVVIELMKVVVDLEKRIKKLEKILIKEDQEISEADLSRVKLLIEKNRFGITMAKIKNRIQSFDDKKVDRILEYLLSIQFIVKKEVTNKSNNTSCYKYFLS